VFLVRILVVGAGVIGSVYAGHLLEAGHSVAVCARGQRLAELRECGLVLVDAYTGQCKTREVAAVSTPDTSSAYDLVLVAVRRDQMLSAAPLVSNLKADVVFFGNAAGLTAELTDAVGTRTLFGFPAAAGLRDGAVVRYVLIRQQKTMLADGYHRRSPRVKALARMFRSAGFPTAINTDAEAWLVAHAAFIVPIAFALYRVDVDPHRLAANDPLLTTMVRATKQALRALQSAGNTAIPRNLRALYLLMPEQFAVRYWRNTLAGPRGQLWFAAHTRAAPEEMASLAGVLRSVVDQSGQPAPDLQTLLAARPA
jgi:2-dehydropantoate 2-reductase